MNYTKEQLREKAEEFIQETWSKPGMSNMVDMLTDFALSLQPLPDREEENICITCAFQGTFHDNCDVCSDEDDRWQPKNDKEV